MNLPLAMPYPVAEALSVEEAPAGLQWSYEPKWDGFRCLAFRDGGEVALQSKGLKPLGRYFPDVVEELLALDAPRFDMTIQGAIGAMSALAFNAFVAETGALQVESGRVAGVAFRVAVRNGVATGTVTPRFNDLSVSVTRGGSHGILGGGGILGGTARGIASFAVAQRLRAANPDRPADAPLVGRIDRTFTPDKTLLAFLWLSLRDGLLAVVKR